MDDYSARQIASELLADLKAGELRKIGIDEVQAAVKAKVPDAGEDFLALVLRKH